MIARSQFPKEEGTNMEGAEAHQMTITITIAPEVTSTTEVEENETIHSNLDEETANTTTIDEATTQTDMLNEVAPRTAEETRAEMTQDRIAAEAEESRDTRIQRADLLMRPVWYPKLSQWEIKDPRRINIKKT